MELTANERVVRLLGELGLTQAEFSRKTGISTATTANIVNITKKLTDKNLQKIKSAFPESNLDYLINGIGKPLLESANMVNEPVVEYEAKDIQKFIERLEEDIRVLRRKTEDSRKLLSILRKHKI
jgi:transcriptional regulator with XRE-family HTH domain